MVYGPEMYIDARQNQVSEKPEDFDLKVAQYEPMYLTPPLSDHDPVFLSLSYEYI